jgi:hypothetical protein
MARIVEFYIPANFKPKIKCVPQGEQGRLVVFPSNLKSQPEIGQFSIEKGLSK